MHGIENAMKSLQERVSEQTVQMNHQGVVIRELQEVIKDLITVNKERINGRNINLEALETSSETVQEIVNSFIAANVQTKNSNLVKLSPSVVTPGARKMSEVMSTKRGENTRREVVYKQNQQLPEKKTKSVNNMNTIYVKTKTGDGSNVLSEIRKAIDPTKLSIEVNNVKKFRNGVAVNCSNRETVEKLRQNLQEGLTDEYEVNIKKHFNPKIIIKHTEKTDTMEESEALAKNIIAQNRISISVSGFEFKIVRKIDLRNGSETHLIVAVDPITRKGIMAKGKIFVGWKSCIVQDSLHIKRCWRCCQYYHLANECKSATVVCALCAGSHETKLCVSKDEEIKCANCIRSNKNFKTKYGINHSAKSMDCPYYDGIMNQMKQNVNDDIPL